MTAGIGSYTSSNCLTGQYYPNWYYYTTPSLARIRLTLSEVDRLRKAAKADAKIKAILSKFTHVIELVVDFEA